ncbi:MAG: hypothetical protein KDC98_07120 [Planctomycetes bacterium]|nr:hypothetical protein [Planctomycetota bacterium]
MKTALSHCVAGVLAGALSLSSSSAQEHKTAWAWVNPAGHTTTTFTPPSEYQYNTGGGSISVRRIANGRYEITVPGLGTNYAGSVHVSGHGGSHYPVVRSFVPTGTALLVNVDVYLANGNLGVDEAFTFSYREGGDPTVHGAYLWANDASNASYTPSTLYSWNGNRADPTIVRSQAGMYQVTLPGLAGGATGERGNVIATVYGTTPGRVNISGWANAGPDLLVSVRTFDTAGNLADRKFLLSYNEFAAPIPAAQGSGAHVWAHDPTTPLYVPLSSWTDSNGPRGPVDAETVTRLGTGRYKVNLPNLDHLGSSNAQVTAYSSTAYATIDHWWTDGAGGTDVFVRTYDAFGTPTDSRFALRYLTDQPAAQLAWCRVDPRLTSVSSWTPSAAWQFNSAGGSITVTRDPAQGNAFTVNMPGMGSELGCVLVSPYDGNHTAVVRAMAPDGVGGQSVLVQLFTPTGAAANDAAFTLLFRRRGGLAEREGYVTHLTPSLSSTAPAVAWNGDRGNPSVIRMNPGDYLVTFPGLHTISSENGCVQATAIGNGLRRAVVRSWTHTGSDLQVRVQCRDVTGAMVDSMFSVHYNEVAAPISPRVGSGAHLYANLPTAANYQPATAYRDSNGDAGPHDMETIQRISTGVYRVFLPDCYAGSSTVQVSPHGVNDNHASIASWGAGPTGAVVEVEVFDENGAPIDGTFTLQYLNHRAITRPASNSVIGTGCNGPYLSGITRPLLARDWHLALEGVPAGAVLGFVQLDLTNPNLSLGTSAPGCTAYTGGAVTVLFGLPAPTPVYSLPIPAVPALVGVSIFAQGGALVPGINAYSLAASNGLQGRIGDS